MDGTSVEGLKDRNNWLTDQVKELEKKIKTLEESLSFNNNLVSRYQKYFVANVMIPNEEYNQICQERKAR